MTHLLLFSFILGLVGSVVLAEGALLWLIAYTLAPAEKDFSLWRGIGVGLLMSGLNFLCEEFFVPRVGDGWGLLAQIIVMLCVVWTGFRLSFWRTIIVMIIFWTIAGLAYYFLVRGG